MKVAVYAGEIPSTSFIDRLINGLSKRETLELYLFGRYKNGHIGYPKGVRVTGFTNTRNQLLLGIRYRLLFLTKPVLWARLVAVWKQPSGLKQRLKYWGKILPVVYAELDIFHVQWAKSLEEWIFLEELGVTVICSLRGAHINYSPLADKKLADTYTLLFPKCSAFHAVSEAILNEAEKYAVIRPRSRVIYSGLNLKDFPVTPVAELGLPLRIISVGRPHWKKGYHYAIRACSILQQQKVDFIYTLVGGRSEELHFLVSDLNLEKKVRFLDKLSINQVKKEIADSDILLLPSVEEGIANVVLESMALGTLVISTDCGGMAEVIEEGVSGFLVPVRDAGAIAYKIQNLRNYTQAERESICSKAREIIELQHQEEHMITAMVELYSTTLQQRILH